MRRVAAVACLVLAAALLPAMPADASAQRVAVTVTNYAFNPISVEIHVGDTVTWTNDAGADHTTTSSGNWDLTIPANGGAVSHTFQAAGDFNYVCRYHSSMKGVVHVLDAAQNDPPTIAISSPAFDRNVSGIVQIGFSARDLNGDSLSVNLRVDNAAWQEVREQNGVWVYAWDTNAVTNGVHTLTARASDGKSQTLAPSVSANVQNAPTLTISGPDEGSNVSVGSELRFQGSATSALGTDLRIDVSLDGGSWIAAEGAHLWSYVWNTSSFSEGDHTLQARASDGATTVLSIVRTVHVIVPPPPPPDAPPEIAILAPGEGSIVAGLVNVTGTASDPDGPAPAVDLSVNGGPWQPASGRAGGSWWFQLVPDDLPAGSITLVARASDAASFVTVTRAFQLSTDVRSLDIEVGAARASKPLTVRVLPATNLTNTTNGTNAIQGAHVVLTNATGETIADALTDAHGNASFAPVAAGNYTLRAYAPGAYSTIDISVRSLYDVAVSPPSAPFDDVVLFTVHVGSDAPARNVPVQLRGAILPGNETGTGRTTRDGNVTFGLQPLYAGEVSVWVAGADTGVRATISPMLVATFTPRDPITDQDISVALTYNDLARSPARNVPLALDLPRATQPQNVTTDAQGILTFRSHAPGIVTLRPEGSAHVISTLLVLPPRPVAELAEFSARPGTASATASVTVRNAGEVPRAFYVDVVALGANGIAVQGGRQSGVLAPGQDEKQTIALKLGVGDYDLVASVRGSNATARSSVHVIDAGIPPLPDTSQQASPTPAAPSSKPASHKLPLGWALVPAALAIAGLARRRRG